MKSGAVSAELSLTHMLFLMSTSFIHSSNKYLLCTIRLFPEHSSWLLNVGAARTRLLGAGVALSRLWNLRLMGKWEASRDEANQGLQEVQDVAPRKGWVWPV